MRETKGVIATVPLLSGVFVFLLGCACAFQLRSSRSLHRSAIRDFWWRHNLVGKLLSCASQSIFNFNILVLATIFITISMPVKYVVVYVHRCMCAKWCIYVCVYECACAHMWGCTRSLRIFLHLNMCYPLPLSLMVRSHHHILWVRNFIEKMHPFYSYNFIFIFQLSHFFHKDAKFISWTFT